MPWRRVFLREAIHLSLIVFWLAVLNHTISTFQVEGASMEPTLHNSQYVVVDTIAPSHRSPQRGEVIVFRYPTDPTQEYVKRVVGLPGETISVGQGRVWVNGQALSEPYIHDRPRYSLGQRAVPQDTVFVLGDNRNSSSDSHLWGPVPMHNVVGRAWFAYRPFSAWTWLANQAPTIDAAPAAR